MSKLNDLFAKELHVVNFGIESFYKDLESQRVPAVHVDWKPVAGGDKEAAGNLRKLKKLVDILEENDDVQNVHTNCAVNLDEIEL